MPILELERAPSKDELTKGIEVPPDPRPYYKGATGFRRGERVEEGKPFPGAEPDQIVVGIAPFFSGGKVELVAFIRGVDHQIGTPHIGLDAPIGPNSTPLANETRRSLARGRVKQSERVGV